MTLLLSTSLIGDAPGVAKRPSKSSIPSTIRVEVWTAPRLRAAYRRVATYIASKGEVALSRHPAWLSVLHKGLGHTPYLIEAIEGGVTRGALPLSLVSSWLFGRFLVGLPYLNTAGVVADSDGIARRLVTEAIRLADQLEVKYLELRHEKLLDHGGFTDRVNGKLHMRLPLPTTAGKLWDDFDAKVRNQIRKAQKNDLTATWGGLDLLDDFYAVFSENMRDLGTPVYGRRLFREILREFPERADLCLIHGDKKPIAGGLLLHGDGISEVPSASSLRAFKSTNANMLLYWNLLQRSVERGQHLFDFGRSSPDSNTYRFKKQWGAEPTPAEWQYYRRNGHVSDARPDNPRFQRFIRLWQKLPLPIANFVGPWIVRGIP